MRYKKMKNHYVIKISRGEEIVEELINFCGEEEIDSAVFYGIGACSTAEIAFYNIDKKEYEPREINEEMEIVSLIGNIAMLDDEHIVHAHIVLSDREMKAFGGHLNRAVISGACEIFLTELDRLSRRYDDDTGLNLLDI